MAIDTAPKLRKKQNLAFALETTTGTPVSLTATAGVTNIFNPQLEYIDEVVEREQAGTSLSPIQYSQGARAARLTFSTEVVGSGTAGTAPSWINLMLACGCQNNTEVITPLTSSMTTLTMGLFVDGRYKLMAGCMGTFKLRGKRAQRFMIDWTFSGVAQPVTDTANIAPTYLTAPVAPRNVTALSFASTAVRFADFTFDIGNTVVMREDVSAIDLENNPTGFRSAMITARKSMFTFTPEALAVATLDVYGLQLSCATSAFSLTLGSATGNTFALAAPKLQIVNQPKDGDRSGLYTDQLDCLATRNTSAGDDEWSLTLT